MTTLTRERRDRHVAALREAHRTGRRKATGAPVDADGGVCTCVIIAEAEGLTFDARTGRLSNGNYLYSFIGELGYGREPHHITGLPLLTPVIHNDRWLDMFGTRSTFDDVATAIAALDVIDEAEEVCRQAADEMVGVG